MNHSVPTSLRIQKARTTLLLDHPFFGTLLFRLAGRPSRSIATMATDGVSLFYNPQFVETLNAAELAGVLAHEVMHPALQHHTRRGDRSLVRWNMACDYAINPILADAGLTLPKDVLFDNRFRGMSAERIYNLIEEDEKEEGSTSQSESQPENGSGGSEDGSLQNNPRGDEPSAPLTPGGIGQVLDAPAPEEGDGPSIAEQAREWQIAVEQAETVAKVAGKLPGGAVRALEAAQAAKVDWRELLRRAWSDTIPADYSWTHPNRRHVWSGLYLPGITSEGVGEIAIAVDCSGSVSSRQLGLFEAEVRSILAGQRPPLVHVLYFDAAVQRVEASTEMLDRFQQFCEAHGEKADRIGRFLRMMEARVHYCRSEAGRLQERARSSERKAAQTKYMVMYYLKSRDLKKIEGREFTLRIQKNSQDSVHFTDETQVPLRYRTVSARLDGLLWERLMENVPDELKRFLVASIQEAAPSNEAIKNAVQNQLAVPGAEVYRGDHLRVA